MVLPVYGIELVCLTKSQEYANLPSCFFQVEPLISFNDPHFKNENETSKYNWII